MNAIQTHLRTIVILLTAFLICGTAAASSLQEDASVPPPPPDEPETTAEPAPDVPVPPPDPPAPQTVPAPPTLPPTAPVGSGVAAERAKAAEEKKAREELQAKCEAEKSAGEPQSTECKNLNLEIVFQGSVGKTAAPTRAVQQVADTESNKLTLEIEKMRQEEDTTVDKGSIAYIASHEPPLFPEEKIGFWSVGVHAGYPILKARGSSIASGFKSIIDMGIEANYQLFKMFQLGLVADVEILKGANMTGTEVVDPTCYTDATPACPEDDTTDLRQPRDVGAMLGNYVGLGLRPTARFDIHLGSFQVALGMGMGWHFLHTSGRWRTKVAPGDRIESLTPDAQWNGDDEAVYSFKLNDSGAYVVFELSAVYRFAAEDRLGLGVLFKYTSTFHGALEADVTVDKSYNLPNTLQGYTTQENDFGDTYLRNLNSLQFITFGLVADYRF